MQEKFKTWGAVLLAAVLTACGGGGGGTSPAPSAAAQVFSQTTAAMPDMRTLFDSMCGNDTGSQVFLADLNADGKKDLVVLLNCYQPTVGSAVVGPANGAVALFTQQSDGTFVNSTRNLTGVDIIRMTGISRKAVVYDFNGDGRDDIMVSVNREDGRTGADNMSSNLNDQNLFITSQTNGQYSYIQQGQTAWNYGLVLADNNRGNKDLISAPIGYGHSAEGWTYQSGWSTVNNYSWVAPTTQFFGRTGSNVGSTTAIASVWDPALTLLQLYTQSGGSWQSTDTLTVGDTATTIPAIGWNGQLGTAKLITVNGTQYLDPAFENSCSLKLRSTDTSPTAIFNMTAVRLNRPYVSGTYDYTTRAPGDTTGISKLYGYQVANNHIVSIPLTINNEKTDIENYTITCRDFNGDGVDDIAVSDDVGGANALIYINDGTGVFNRISSSNLPVINTYSRGQAYVIGDINGDGVMDLLFYPVNGVSTGPVTFQYFKGNRAASTLDFMP